MRNKVILGLVWLTCSATASAFPDAAEGGNKASYVLGRFDTNGDKVITKAEFLASADERFAAMDMDGNKSISLAEFLQRYQDYKQAHAQHHQASFTEQDNNNDGKISQAEYLQAAQKHAELMFSKKDQDGDKQLSPAELHNASKPAKMLSGEEHTPEKVFAKIDSNGDQQITPAEYSASRLQWFAEMDKDADGKITAAELAP